MSFHTNGTYVGNNKVKIEHESLIECLELLPSNTEVVFPSLSEGDGVYMTLESITSNTRDGHTYYGVALVESIHVWKAHKAT